MTTLHVLKEVLTPALVRALGFALLHSLWQGAGLAGLLAIALGLLRQRRPEVRYWLAASSLALLVLAIVGTFGHYYLAAPAAVATSASSVATAAFGAEPGAAPAALSGVISLPAPGRLAALALRAEPYLPLLVAAWLVGLLLMSGRLAGGLLYAGRLRRAARPVRGGAAWSARLAALAHRAGLRRPVRLLESARVDGPLVLGHLRPVILLPLGAVAALPPALLEALLAHEVAHLLRRDYLLNLALSVVETALFYHPAVWFMAACLRAERENCCDDQAAVLCGGDRLRVARALAALAELTVLPPASVPRLALAATGSGGGRGSLLARVRRLALGQAPRPVPGEGLLAAGLLLLGLLGLSTGVVLAAAPLRADARQFVRARVSGWGLTSQLTPADTTRRKRLPATAAVPAMPTVPVVPAAPTIPAVTAAPAAPTAPAAPIAASASPAVPAPPASALPPDTLRRARRRRVFAGQDAPGSVVIRQDRKGRLTDLVVNGQRIETAGPGKKRRGRDKEVEVQVMQLPAPPLPPLPPRRLAGGAVRADVSGQVFSFDFDTDGFRRQFEQADEELREAARELRGKALRLELETRAGGRKFMKFDFQPRFRMLGDSNRVGPDGRRHLELRIESSLKATAKRQREAQARAEQQLTERTDELRDRLRAGAARREQTAEAGEAAARQAELRARIAEARARLTAREAELRALEAEADARPRRQGPGTPPPPLPPPAPDANRLREELRRDGLLGKNDRSYSFSLTESEARVNGRALTPAQAARYRRLFDVPAAGSGKGRRTVSITVTE